MEEKLEIKGRVVCILDGPSGKKVIRTRNIITDDGDIFYAQKETGETPTNDFSNMVLGSGSTTPSKTSTYDSITPIANTNKAPEVGYPKANDDDPDNAADAGPNVITWKYYYAKEDFAASSITEAVITVADPTAGSKVLTHFRFEQAFPKTSNDVLIVFVNHEVKGV